MDEFVELTWENGNLVMRRPNNKKCSSTSFVPTPFDDGTPTRSPQETKKKKEQDAGTLPKILQPSFASGLFWPGSPPTHEHEHVGEGETETETDTVPWINYNYPVFEASDYCSQLLSDLNPNPNPSRPRDVPPPVPILKSRQDVPPSTDRTLPRAGLGLVNFSHFSRLRSNAKASTSCNDSPLQSSTVIDSATALPPSQRASLPLPQTLLSQTEALTTNNYCDNVPPPSSQPLQRNQLLERDKETDKGAQPVLASSSVCSRNVDPKHDLKRKNLEEDFLSHPEDVEDESVGSKRPSTSKGMGTKRSRTAEVHNLSERRRRDRISEKMRVLQELIPNCNKVDKASMLDEAIEYLKSLQLQVQMMAMGTRMCIPPIMLPPGLHHMPIPPFPQMGMGMGYGMGPLDINHSAVIHMAPLPLPPAAAVNVPFNFMPLINDAITTYENGNGIPQPPPLRPQHICPTSSDKANACNRQPRFEAAAQGSA